MSKLIDQAAQIVPVEFEIGFRVPMDEHTVADDGPGQIQGPIQHAMYRLGILARKVHVHPRGDGAQIKTFSVTVPETPDASAEDRLSALAEMLPEYAEVVRKRRS